MGLFSNKQPAQLEHETGYQDVVDYLTAMEQPQYNKLLKVVEVYRKADKEVAKILPLEKMPPVIMTGDFLSDDDTELGNFLDDEPPLPMGKVGKMGAMGATKSKPKSKKSKGEN